MDRAAVSIAGAVPPGSSRIDAAMRTMSWVQFANRQPEVFESIRSGDPMHRRYQNLNIPIEIVRTVVAISETGSLSKAGERLGLSQPAISSQIKRLQGLVGGALFLKTANGTTTTELGKLALQQARRILEANDQLLRLGGNTEGIQPLRLGLSTFLVQQFIRHQTSDITRRYLHPCRPLGADRKGLDRRLYRHRLHLRKSRHRERNRTACDQQGKGSAGLGPRSGISFLAPARPCQF